MHDSTRIIFIHGLIGPLNKTFLMDGAQSTQMLAPDMLGYGSLADVDPAMISLDTQVEYLHKEINAVSATHDRWYLVGHSVGGAIAALFAAAYPDRVEAVISVEGNFTLDDAFWSQKLAKMPLEEVQAKLLEDRSEPAKWLHGAGVKPTEATLLAAATCLSFQPASTLQQMAASVVDITGKPAYLNGIERWVDNIPLHLIAGERSAKGWHIPAWVQEKAASYREMKNCGHLMMLEDVHQFSSAITAIIEKNKASLNRQ
jgi:pimeloyl-ACP methyl ester carboxylesterase